MSYKILKYFLSLLLFTAFISFGNAQQPTSEKDTTNIKKIVPVSSIIEESINDQQQLLDISKKQIPQSILNSFTSDANELADAFHEYQNIRDTITKARLSIYELEQEKRSWKQVEGKNTSITKKISSAIEDLISKRDKINKTREKWNETLLQINSDTIYDPLRVRILSLLSFADSTSGVLGKQLGFMLEVQARVAEVSLKIKNQLDRINLELQNRTINHVKIDNSPIWNWSENTYGNESAISQFQKILRDEIPRLKTFVADFSDEIKIHLSVFIAFLLIFVFVKYRIKQMTFDTPWKDAFQKVVGVYKYPVSIALILSAYFTLFIYNASTLLFAEIIIFIFLLGMINLVGSLLTVKGSRYIYCLMILFFFSRLVGMTLYQTNSVRLLIILIDICGFAISFYSLFIDKFPDKLENSNLKVIIKLIVYLSLCSFAVSIISNIIGATEFSVLFCTSPLKIIMATTLFYISMQIYKGIVLLFMSSKSIMSIHIFQKHKHVIISYAVAIINMLFLFLIINSLFKIIGISDVIWSSIFGFLNEDRMIGEFDYNLLSIILFIIVVYIAFLFGKIIKYIIEDGVLFYFNMKKGVAMSVGSLLRYIIITAGFIIAISAMGISTDRLTVLMGAFGVGIGFGLQNIFNNLVSGFILLFDRSIQLDDTVEVGNIIGRVKNIGLRSSSIKTYDGAEVVVPNGNLISNNITNWTLSDSLRRIELIVGVAYGSNLSLVKEVVTKAVEQNKDVIRYPRPLVLLNNLSDSSLDFRILFWTDNYDEWVRIKGEVLFEIYNAIDKAGISIPFPQRDIHIKDFNNLLKKPENPSED